MALGDIGASAPLLGGLQPSFLLPEMAHRPLCMGSSGYQGPLNDLLSGLPGHKFEASDQMLWMPSPPGIPQPRHRIWIPYPDL